MTGGWPRWEVFLRARRGLSHGHVGSVHAADGETALQAARDLFTRRQEGISIWVVPSGQVVASDPADQDSLFEPADDKGFRFPTSFELPSEVDQM